MTFINWESLLKITHAENTFSCLPDYICHLLSLLLGATSAVLKADLLSDSDINALILDYLTTEGYSSAAAKFSKEANLRPQQEEESVVARQKIQHDIHLGSIEDAIDSLNELEPSVCTYNHSFYARSSPFLL